MDRKSVGEDESEQEADGRQDAEDDAADPLGGRDLSGSSGGVVLGEHLVGDLDGYARASTRTPAGDVG